MIWYPTLRQAEFTTSELVKRYPEYAAWPLREGANAVIARLRVDLGLAHIPIEWFFLQVEAWPHTSEISAPYEPIGYMSKYTLSWHGGRG